MEDEKSHQEPSTSKSAKIDVSDEEGDENNGFETDTSSGDSDSVEKCPICLLKFSSDQEIGKPISCNHAFCFACIEEWSKIVRTCPIDRTEFKQINVYDNLEDNNLLRTVDVGEQISLKDYTATEAEEYTACEICGSVEREEVMLLCDGCDKGFHMDCLIPAMDHIPIDNWYCQECNAMESSESEEEEDADELNDLQEEITSEIGTSTRLRSQPQPQIVRTLQSERIRNAILARRTLRGIVNIQPSTSTANNLQPATRVKRKSPVKKRKTYRRKRSTVVEYEVRECGGKFPIKTKKKRKTRKRRKRRRVCRRASKASTRNSTTSSARSFSANQNVFELQHARHQAGVSNFNIFEPMNLLDYVPDEEETAENETYSEAIAGSNSDGGVLIQGTFNTVNPLRRKALIKKRVIDNFTTTSNSCDLIDSILNENNFFAKPSNQINYSEKVAMTKASDDNSNLPKETRANESADRNETKSNSLSSEITFTSNSLNQNSERNEEEQKSVTESFSLPEKSPPKKKRPVFDMFDDKTPEREDTSECPNFSIYNLDDEQENIEENPSHAENFDDLVQMSDEGEQEQNTDIVSEENEPVVIFKSQPASPDLENEQERSYTPPLIKVDQQKVEIKSSSKFESNRKSKKQSRRQELERYNVRDRFREKSPLRARDRFGRNRSRTRSNSRSRSQLRNRRKSKSNERKQRQRSRSDSRRRDSSGERRRKKNKHKKSVRKSRSQTRSISPPRRRNYRDEKSPKRNRKRDRTPSPSEKSKKKKCARSNEKSSGALSKEIYTSGQNILVSVNFSSQAENRPFRSTSHDDKEPIVDITAKKKINVISKPVAIIDLARSPFKELTPEYKKESNVIELSDSEGEKHDDDNEPKSPDSTKLYDPFDILNSPTNENVSSSQQNSIVNFKTSKTIEHREFNLKGITQTTTSSQQKSLSTQITEENVVTSSSNAFEKIFPTNSAAGEVIQNERIQNPNTGIESPYSPGAHDDAYHDVNNEDESSFNMSNVSSKPTGNLFDELFGSSSPPGLDRIKGSKKSDTTNKYINKLKRQERVIEEVKGAIKPHYSKRSITKEQYKEIMRKAVPKICHSKSGEINPAKIKILIDSYVKFYAHVNKKKRPGVIDESF